MARSKPHERLCLLGLVFVLACGPAQAQLPPPSSQQPNEPPPETFSHEAPAGMTLPDDPHYLAGVWTMRKFDPPSAYTLKPEAVGKTPEWAPMKMGVPGAFTHLCAPRGNFGGGTYPTEIIQTPQQVTIINEENHRVRRVYLDGRPHPKNLKPSYGGHSIGHWEGDTLVVDTVGATSPPGDYTPPDQHIIERFRRLPGGRQLEQTVEVMSSAYATPSKSLITYNWRPDVRLMEEICEENNAIFEGPEWNDKAAQ